VSAQAYATEPWPDLVNLWLLPEASLAHQCVIGGNPPVALSALIEDYVRHLEHHLDQILG
jgi:hypothetical protein